MPQYIGEYSCKLDDKGRVILPSALKRQLPQDQEKALVINRGFDKCLTLFTRQDWLDETQKLAGLNEFNRQDRRFMRLFNSGATEIGLDNASRILIPKKLAEYAELEAEVVFYAYGNKIEIWSRKNYDEQMEIDPDEFSSLAEEVMSPKKRPDGDDN
ncbi:MAG: division/cell wall cluster transcriptional repressor MraZ [Flavobacteriales bacterium]|nr:division/cell wall cluster transcriptional repressor MraZ [Flavobacteriales bacterium]